MKLVDKMKDEKLGCALLYNFTKGYGHVPMDVYDLVLPLLFNDTFRNNYTVNTTFVECINKCINEDSSFLQQVINDENTYKEVTSRSLGIALLNQNIKFEVEDKVMKGIYQDSSILDFVEAIQLGKEFQGKTHDEIMSFLKENDFKIVFLDSQTLGKDVNLDGLNRYGELINYDEVEQDAVADVIQEANVVITNKHYLGKEQLEKAHKLELICVTATGVNNIDLDYCHSHNITVCNVKGYSTDSVSQHTFALLLDLYNKNHYYNEYIASGNYSSSSMFTHFGYTFNELTDKVWGIVGMGDIGRKVASIADAFGCKVVYYSTSGKNTQQDYQQVSFDELLANSDIISIHAPLNEQTLNLFDETAISKMKKTSYLINVGRGKIVNEEALAKALINNQIAGAGLDVFENEPFYLESPLLKVKDATKLIMTPHIAWAAVEARNRCIDEVCLNIEGYKTKKLRNVC